MFCLFTRTVKVMVIDPFFYVFLMSCVNSTIGMHLTHFKTVRKAVTLTVHMN